MFFISLNFIDEDNLDENQKCRKRIHFIAINLL